MVETGSHPGRHHGRRERLARPSCHAGSPDRPEGAEEVGSRRHAPPRRHDFCAWGTPRSGYPVEILDPRSLRVALQRLGTFRISPRIRLPPRRAHRLGSWRESSRGSIHQTSSLEAGSGLGRGRYRGARRSRGWSGGVRSTLDPGRSRASAGPLLSRRRLTRQGRRDRFGGSETGVASPAHDWHQEPVTASVALDAAGTRRPTRLRNRSRPDGPLLRAGNDRAGHGRNVVLGGLK
jgi:hypothetical protein